MIEITGKYNTAKIFSDTTEEAALKQIYELLDQEFITDSKIRFMSDLHAGMGCVIGTTMTIKDKIVPNFCGVDIGCGMLATVLEDTHIELNHLDKIMHQIIPSGFAINNKDHRFTTNTREDELRCKKHIDMRRISKSLGSLGGGNHFGEVNKDDEGNLYLVIHTGSRNLGKQVCDYYQQTAYEQLTSLFNNKGDIIKQLKVEGREKEIEAILKATPSYHINKHLAYCQNELFDDYLHDMVIVQEWASWNRKAILDTIQCGMRFKIKEQFETIHNYIDIENMILRKGAVSAKKDEQLIIPISPSYGSLICVGLGNEDWNQSAPHGAGRLMSRKKAKETLTMENFKDSMKGIFTTCVNHNTLDECPMAYKDPQEIIDSIGDTVDVIKTIKPIYNFKASTK